MTARSKVAFRTLGASGRRASKLFEILFLVLTQSPILTWNWFGVVWCEEYCGWIFCGLHGLDTLTPVHCRSMERRNFVLFSYKAITLTFSSRPRNESLSDDYLLVYDNESCFESNVNQNTPEYKAYEQFSLLVGMLTLGKRLAKIKCTIFHQLLEASAFLETL